MHRFYIPAPEWNPESLVLTGDESRHCAEVLRCRVGDSVTVFNGQGAEAATTITELTREKVLLAPAPVTRSQPLPAAITLGQAIPKGKNMDLVIQKATELGAAAIVPIVSERTIVRIEKKDAEAKREKWQRGVIEACKQCGQNWLPDVAEPQKLDQYLTPATIAEFDLAVIASLQPGSQPLQDVLKEYREVSDSDALPAKVLVLVGPEGDYTPAETSLATAAGCRPLSLGPIVLRVETASIYCLSILAYELQRRTAHA